MQWRRVVGLVALLCALTGCKIRGDVVVSVANDGSGTVSVDLNLDAEAARLLGDPKSALALTDLAAAGWTVGDVHQRTDGLDVQVSKPFGSPDGLTSVMGELGIFEGWDLRVEDDLWERRWSVSGAVRAPGGVEAFSDDSLSEALAGRPLGMNHDELVQRLASGSVELDVVVDLPGDTDDTSRFTIPLGTDSVDRSIRVDAAEGRDGVPSWFVVGGILVVATAAWVVLSPVVTRRR